MLKSTGITPDAADLIESQAVLKPCDHTGKPLEVCPCKSCKGWRKLMRAKKP